MEKLLTIQEVSKLFKVTPSLIYKWVHYGFVPHIKLGTRVRFKKSALEKWLIERKKRKEKIPSFNLIIARQKP
ncbi:MAG: helix-turn-helix domain-containing protein [Candidatus Omnitrophica bacterium]|nr:helix-turn-helix domain-containing protein [Candidatus Omnitrophota bacterium]